MNQEPMSAALDRCRPTQARVHEALDLCFVCPRDRGPLVPDAEGLRCQQCNSHYPVVREIPVFICDERSVFAQADFRAENIREIAGTDNAGTSYVRALRKLDGALIDLLGPGSTSSIRRPFYPDVVSMLLQRSGKQRLRVLVIGSGGLSYQHPLADVVCTDVAFGSHVRGVVDAHDLPFSDGSFDLAVAVAVLEHVADPQRCVAELWRVLANAGFVFAVTPFLEPVHLGAHDFTRFTPMGHRRLFRWFDTVESGVAMGAGSMLAYALNGFLISISKRRAFRNVANLISLTLACPLRKLDRLFDAEASADNAAGCYFIGMRRDEPIPDRVLIGQYIGGFHRTSA